MAEKEELRLTFCVYLNEDYYNHFEKTWIWIDFFCLSLINVEVIKIILNGIKALWNKIRAFNGKSYVRVLQIRYNLTYWKSMRLSVTYHIQMLFVMIL